MFKVKNMAASDIPFGMRLTKLAGWNQTESDWRRFLALSPASCWVAECDSQPVATTVAFLFGRVGWIAMVLVAAAYRGRGIATALMRHALDWLDANGVVTARLDATAQGRPVYQRLGFADEYELVRYHGIAQACPPEGEVRACDTPGCLDQLLELDQRVTGTARGALLRALASDPGVTTRITRQNGQITGYLMDRPGARARQLGPAVAVDAATGRALLADAARRLAGGPVFWDLPLPNAAAGQWATANGLSAQRTFQRMWRGVRLTDHPQQIWASSGPEKG
jgi:GNAT superfamily N-acetyltransferase